jgi:hypothetical protein
VKVAWPNRSVLHVGTDVREKTPPRCTRGGRWTLLLLLLFVCVGGDSIGASGVSRPATIVTGRVLDMTGAVLPGATVDLLASSVSPMSVVSDARGEFTFESIATGRYEIVVRLLNFTTWREPISVTNGRRTTLAIVLDLALSADVVVSGRRAFRNLAELENPRENLVGVAASASEGGARLGAAVRRRRRNNRAGPAEHARRHRVEQLCQSPALAGRRHGRLVVPWTANFNSV